MSFIDDIKKCIHSQAEVIGIEKNNLIEKKTKPPTQLQLQTEGIYLLYDFEKLKNPFPFFATTADAKGLNAVADYVIFTECKGLLWVVVVELKNKKGDPRNQLFATKQFANYLIQAVNRQCKKDYTIQIRGIAYSKLCRPTTKINKPYDNLGNAYISGKKLNLSNFLI